MEMYCSLEESNMHLLETDRQGYHVGPAFDRQRFLQRPKQQNCASVVPNYWDMHHEIPGTSEEVNSRHRFEDENFRRSCRYDLTRSTGKYQGDSLEKHNAAGWYDVANLYSRHEIQRNTLPSMPYYLYSSGSEGTPARDLAANAEHCMGRINVNMDMQSSMLHNHFNSTGNASSNMHEIWNYNMGVWGSCHTDPLVCRNPLTFLGSEPTEGLAGNSSEFGHDHNVGRGSWKRKRSTDSVTGSCSFETSHSFGVREYNPCRIISGARLNRLDVPTFAAASSAYVTHTPSAASYMLDHHHPRGILMGVQNFLRESGRSSFPFSSVDGAFQRSVRMRPSNTPFEQALFRLHFPPITDSRRVTILQPRSHLRNTFSAQQSVVLNSNDMWRSHICDTDRWVPSVKSQRTSFHSSAGSSGQNLSPLGEGYCWVGLAAFPGMRSLLDRCYPRSLPLGTADSIDSRLVRQMCLDPRIMSIMMARNAPENYMFGCQAATSSLVYSDSSASHAHLSILPAAGPPQGIMAPLPSSAFTSHIVPASMEMVPSVSGYQVPYLSTIHRHQLFNSHSENFMVPHPQGIPVMPFHRQHMLRTDAENQHDISPEESVMLDQSVVLGGTGILDQHSDMQLDVDNMSYEELLALEERIGSVSTGLSEEAIMKCLRTSIYLSLDDTVATVSEENDAKCCICQEEYVKDDNLGGLECGHTYHIPCIKQWLTKKNQCPICKATACSKT